MGKSDLSADSQYFNPRPPWGGRLAYSGDCARLTKISIHALRGEGDGNEHRLLFSGNISIHALRGEGDAFSLLEFVPLYDISIHALRGEGDNDNRATHI